MKRLLIVAVLLAPAIGTAAEVAGTWQGSYTCNQGLTGFTLSVLTTPGGAAKGVFRFYPVEGNPGVPDGCFTMIGTVSGDALRLQAGHWLYRPRGYVMVDLAGTLSSNGAALTGSVFGPNCTTFEVQRVFEDANPAACRLSDAPVS